VLGRRDQGRKRFALAPHASPEALTERFAVVAAVLLVIQSSLAASSPGAAAAQVPAKGA